jgi:hypothetical protein
LVLFGLLTYASVQGNRELRHGRPSRYFWWGSIRLDSDCKQVQLGDCAWDAVFITVEPGWLEKALIISSLPAFLLGKVFVRGFARLGVSELAIFMGMMPVLILVWFYGVGWLLDRWQHKRTLRRSSASS